MMIRVLILLPLLVVACATQPLFSPAKTSNSVGYYETQLTDNRYRVIFAGGSRTSLEMVKNLALLRAAELTVENGYDWFEIVDRETEDGGRKSDAPRVTVRVGVGTGGGRCFPFGCRVYGGPFYSGLSLHASETNSSRQSEIEIFMGKGESPEPTKVYNAEELEKHLRELTRNK